MIYVASASYHIQRTRHPHQIRPHSVWCRHKPEIETDTGLGSYKQTPCSVHTGDLRVKKATRNDFFPHCTSAQAFQVYFKCSLNIAYTLLHKRHWLCPLILQIGLNRGDHSPQLCSSAPSEHSWMALQCALAGRQVPLEQRKPLHRIPTVITEYWKLNMKAKIEWLCFYTTSVTSKCSLQNNHHIFKMCLSSYRSTGGLHLSYLGSRHHHHTSSAGVYSDLCDTGSCWAHMYGGPLVTKREKKAQVSWQEKD